MEKRTKLSSLFTISETTSETGCKGFKTWTDCGYEFDCGYNTVLTCDDCKYGLGGGRKNPAAKCNQAND